MAYDSLRKRVVLFGGQALESQQLFTDTWDWDGNDWADVTPTVRPSYASAMAYSPELRCCVLYMISPAETWHWDGAAWMRQLSPNHPIIVSGGCLLYTSPSPRDS